MLTNKNFYTQIIGLCFSFTPGCKLDTVSRFAFCVLRYEVCLQFVRDFFVCSVGCVIISCPVHVLEPLLCTCFFSLWLTVFLVCLNSLFIIQGDLLETARGLWFFLPPCSIKWNWNLPMRDKTQFNLSLDEYETLFKLNSFSQQLFDKAPSLLTRLAVSSFSRSRSRLLLIGRRFLSRCVFDWQKWRLKLQMCPVYASLWWLTRSLRDAAAGGGLLFTAKHRVCLCELQSCGSRGDSWERSE